MSWSIPLRVLGVCGLWLGVMTGCGGNPSAAPDGSHVGGGSGTANAGTGGRGNNGGTSSGGTSPDINTGNTGGQDPDMGGTGNQPTSYDCGNGELEPGEFCDDGNTTSDDGCSGDCKELDPDYDCSEAGQPCVKVVVCGDSVIEGDEACDDGNTAAEDGCSADCSTVESGFECVRPGKDCVKVSVCGNGVRERGEVCDDHNAAPGDGCDDKCQIEPGFYCPVPGQACAQKVCGDGTRVPGEECDDDNTKDNDGCSHLCKIESGWHCNSMGCKPECGDGLLRGSEVCDDGNVTGGDGCSSACRVEPFFECTQASPSKCKSTIACNNGKIEPGEVCDPPGTGGCLPGCKSVDANAANPPVCGNKIIEGQETCDPPMLGCSATCAVQNGYTCPQAEVCFPNPACGDNIVQTSLGEGCDPPNVGNGCTAGCKVESGWTCGGLGPSTCVKPQCGNKAVEPGEECDDGSSSGANDGCVSCAIQTGWSCPNPGAACIPKCGDGLKLGNEQCDDKNRVSGDGCNAGCKIEVGYSCPTPGQACVASVCGNGPPKDKGEGCDDGNKISGDGCGATCQLEPTVTVGPNPTVNVKCGDGIVTGSEVCDDGNTDNNDGCEGNCAATTAGWSCSSKLTLPPSISMQVTYRDFKKRSSSGGHPDFEWDVEQLRDVPGPVCTSTTTECTAAAGTLCPAGTCGHLDNQGKPAFHRNASDAAITSANTFSLWYRDTNPGGITGQNGAIGIFPIKSSLLLTQSGGTNSDVYVYDNTAFWPLTGQGFGNDGNNQNFHFTTELRYFFQYKGGETLTFRGDDDVWVFVNGHLAVDIGGVHAVETGRVILGDDGDGAAADSNCSIHQGDPNAGFPACALEPQEVASDDDIRFDLVKGEVYEIVLFQAERHTVESNFRLTLAGFLAPTTSCETICGDGVVAGDEFCDDGANNSDTVSGACNTSCTARQYCGDGVRQLPGEACDNGTNTDLYKTPQSPASVCAPGCKVPASCGDGVLQAGFEQCDKGNQNNDAAYGPDECTTECKLGGFCGDGTTQSNRGEACDRGTQNGKEYGTGSCGYDCQPGPRCGDDIKNGSEQCDDGADNGTDQSNCQDNCKLKLCGNGLSDPGEECDYAQFASDEYGGCTAACTWGPRCGDGGPGNTPDPEEECDYGAAKNTGAYGGCTSKCALGPHCGDGVKNGSESCDNGFNEDEYNDPNTAETECGQDCTPVPFCGDDKLQPSYELCDHGGLNSDTTYNGCTTKCEFGPYCGDGETNGPETCDDGSRNVGYSPTQGACSYDCQPAPYCGDGERNGPEQCDLGPDQNTGDYGGCNEDCTFAPRCGDGVTDEEEECDDGPTGSLQCSTKCQRRDIVQ